MIKLIGASGHAKVILDILLQGNLEVSGFYDDNLSIQEFKGLKSRGSVSQITPSQDLHIISIGVNSIRAKIANRLSVSYTMAIHSSAVLSPSTNIGEGSVVMAGAVVNADSVIGKHCILNTQCSIDHDCIIEDFVHISPNACITGGVYIGEGAHIGAGAVIIPGVKIGSWSTIGAGAVVIRDVEPNTVVVGNPAKPLK